MNDNVSNDANDHVDANDNVSDHVGVSDDVNDDAGDYIGVKDDTSNRWRGWPWHLHAYHLTSTCHPSLPPQ